MNKTEAGNKRIAKNTAVLYLRMLIMMFISFYTARITLNALGVDDYGINNVVGGLVSMFSILSSSLSAATSRFMTFGLGQGDLDNLKKIFSTTINIHIILALVVVIAIESVGVWFLNHKMTIPSDRIIAANWAMQCSIAVFAIGLMSVPYNSAIIAHEKMSAFAYMTIFDATFKLIIAFGIYYYGGDKLILLSILTVIQSIIRQCIYWIYCKRKFKECVYIRGRNKQMEKSIFSFAGWNFIGSTAALMKDQGVNIAINLFTGPSVNAARGIAMQVNGIVTQFIGGFMTALTPQITKSYAIGELERMHNLIYQGTRLSYFLFMTLSIPIFFEIENILFIWLGQVPDHTVLFARLVLILSLTEIISNTLITSQLATGNIKKYQIVVGGILFLNFPISYICLQFGLIPESTIVVAIFISQICMLARLWFLRNMIKLSAKQFIKRVYINVIAVTIIAIIPPLTCYLYIKQPSIRLYTLPLVSITASISAIYFIGCNTEEKLLVRKYAYRLKQKIKRK